MLLVIVACHHWSSRKIHEQSLENPQKINDRQLFHLFNKELIRKTISIKKKNSKNFVSASLEQRNE